MKFRKIALILLTLSLLASMFSCKDEKDDGGDERFGWNFVSYENGILKKQKTAENGREYTFAANYEKVGDNAGVKPEEDDGVLMIAQWALSVGTLDTFLQFPLFPEEIVKDRVYPELSKMDLSFKEAEKKFADETAKLFPFGSCRFECSLFEILLDDPDMIREYVNGEKEYFEALELDAEKIEHVAVYKFERAVIYYDDKFYLDFMSKFGSEFIAYQYDGTWYLDRNMLDYDFTLSECLIENRNGSDEQIETVSYIGNVSEVTEDYVCINGVAYYSIKGIENVDVSVGDVACYECYNFNMKLKGVPGYKDCFVGAAVSIRPYH